MPTTERAYYKLSGKHNRKGLEESILGCQGFLHHDSTHFSLAEAILRKDEIAPYLDSWTVYREEIIRTPVASSEDEDEYS